MLWTIVVSDKKDFVCVHLFSGETLLANWTVDELYMYLQWSTKFVKIAWTIVNINEIKFIEPYNPDEIEIFIATQNDPRVKKELQQIIKERQEKNLKTNNVAHLWDIYEKK